jgi:hypothetical protein
MLIRTCTCSSLALAAVEVGKVSGVTEIARRARTPARSHATNDTIISIA